MLNQVPRKPISRRRVIALIGTLGGLSAALPLMAACGQPAASPTAAPSSGSSAPAPAAPTAASAATATAAPAPTAAPVPTTAPAAAPAAAGSKAQTTLEVWVWEDLPHWQKVIQLSGIETAIPEVKLKYTPLPSDQLHQKFLVGLAAGMPAGMPNIARTNMNNYRAMVNTGGLVETTDYIKEFKKDIVSFAFDDLMVQGKQYAVPDDIIVTMLGYQIEQFAKAGLPTEPEKVGDLLATWDDFIKIMPDKAKQLGVNLMNFGPDAGFFSNIAGQDTTGWFDVDGNPIFDSPAHVKAMEIVKKIWDIGPISSLSGPQFWGAFGDGQILTYEWPQYVDFVILDFAAKAKGKWRVAPLPAVQAGGHRAWGLHCCNLVFPKSDAADKRDLAIKVALYLRMTKEGTVAHMQSFPGAFVSYVPGLEAMRDQPSPVLDGQKTYDYFLNAMAKQDLMPRYYNSIYFTRTESEFIKNAAFAILKENAPIAETLKKAADGVRELQKSSGKM